MIDIEKLEALAKAVRDGRYGSDAYYEALHDYGMACSPAAVLELIGEVARSQRMVVRAACDLGAISEALGADMDDDVDHVLGMIRDLREERDRLAADNKALAEDPGSAL